MEAMQQGLPQLSVDHNCNKACKMHTEELESHTDKKNIPSGSLHKLQSLIGAFKH